MSTILPTLKQYDFVDCNVRLATFLQSSRFIIPRVAGIENNTAYFGALRRDIPDRLRQVMKMNAGILLPTNDSVHAYSRAYLHAFQQCDLYASWEPWGNYAPHIAESQSFIQNNFCKPQVGAFVFDIFHYLNTPWTHALRGKRLLLVSPFVDMFQTQPNAYQTKTLPIYKTDLKLKTYRKAQKHTKNCVKQIQNLQTSRQNVTNYETNLPSPTYVKT
jgi:hypothetical protein